MSEKTIHDYLEPLPGWGPRPREYLEARYNRARAKMAADRRRQETIELAVRRCLPSVLLRNVLRKPEWFPVTFQVIRAEYRRIMAGEG